MKRKLLALLLICALLLGAVPPMLATDYEEPPGAEEPAPEEPEVPEESDAEEPDEPEDPPVQRDFPAMHITSALNPFIQEREFWHTGALTVESGNEDWAFADVDVRLRGRGNSTWWHGPDKRPLRIRFETPQPMFGSAYPHRDWILLANAFDNSLLRTHFSLYLAELLGYTGFVPSSQFVHLYVNGTYMGVYQFTDERDIGPGRGEVVIDPDPVVSEYWLEMDYRTQDYFQVNGLWYDIRFPSGNALTEEHIDYAHAYIESVSQAIRNRDWEAVTALIDIPSHISYYILQELIKDADVSFSSMFMQIRGQGDERRLYQGPVWDFDLALGNARSATFHGDQPTGLWAARRHYWFRGLMHIPEFREQAIERWNEAMTYDIPRAIASTEYMLATYREAFERNFEAQPVLGVRWGVLPAPARYEIDTFVGQVEYLLDFINARAEWLDNYFNTYPPLQLPTFDDVDEGAWYHDAIEFVSGSGLMNGISVTVFAPEETLSRAMVTTILWRLSGEPETEWSPVFTDVPEDAPSWYRTAVMWAQETGVVTGHDGEFHPEGDITREQMAAMLHRYTEWILEGDIDVPEDFDLDGFADSDEISSWAEAYMLWANYTDLILGTRGALLDPDGTTTRAQAATILMRYVQRFIEQELVAQRA